jgi:type IV pilus assembly protein PilA
MNRKAFTLLELIVVLVVLAALVAIALPMYTGFVEKAKASEAIGVMGSIKTAEEIKKAASSSHVYVDSSFADLSDNLGVTVLNVTPGWSYTVAANGGAFFTATAVRKNPGGPADNKTIVFTYNNDGSVAWSGDHPGRPR